MDLTTGAILRRITRTHLSVAAHKLATLILDGIAWKDGYNGLTRGTAAFALSDLAARMAVSRQYLHSLLSELAGSGLRLVRTRLRGRHAIWLFRFGCGEEGDEEDQVSTAGDTSPYREDIHKTLCSGMIVLDCESAGSSERWLGLIDQTKAALPCRAMTSRHIWERFRAFNRSKGRQAVPAGYLLGFMRKWRAKAAVVPRDAGRPVPELARPPIPELQRLIALAPIENRHFHQRDLVRRIGEDAYRARVMAAATRFDSGGFSAELAVHGMAVHAGEIGR